MSCLLYQLIFVISFTATTFAACGHDLTLRYGKITSPAYPKPYPPSQQCEWKASTAAGKTLTLEFLNVDINEGGETCTDDFITIEKAGDINPTTICGSVRPAIMTIPLDADVSISFQSGSIQRTNKGFIIVYMIRPDPKTTTSPNTTAAVTTGNQTTVSTTTVLRTKKSGDKMSGGTIAVIFILVLLVVLLIIDLILYQKEMGLLYTIKTKCCTEYGSIDGSKC